MHILSVMARSEGLILLIGLFFVVFRKLLTWGIGIDQLLKGETSSNGRSADGEHPHGWGRSVSMGRVQSLAVTAGTALYYVVQVFRNPKRFPELPTILLAVFLGSQAVYLAGEAQTMPRLKNFLQRKMS